MASIRNDRPYSHMWDVNSRHFKHHPLPKYAPFEPYEDVRLDRKAYKARDLLNFTVKAFYSRQDDDLTKQQRSSRDAFSAWYVIRCQAYGREMPVGEPIEPYQEDITYMAEKLDEFFFFKFLKQHVALGVGLDVVGRDPLGIDDRIEGETFPCRERDREYSQVNINIGSNGKFHELSAIVGQLIHEMVHAYLQSFVCNCRKCSTDGLNTVGVEHDGHGPVFLMLHRLILTEVRRWGHRAENDLGVLLLDDCPEASVSRSAGARAKAALDTMEDCERKKFNPVRNFALTANNLIRIVERDGSVAVNPSLIKRQIKMEYALRARAAHREEFEEEALRNFSVQAEARAQQQDFDDGDTSSDNSNVPLRMNRRR